ncbi:hypothetical protein M426DRAFT_76561 [Hypoxylon sp. CI-4A]|nr:hypothetical protein M426DRAFT_76561 [Hypoxylon sp. CI-4A]
MGPITLPKSILEPDGILTDGHWRVLFILLDTVVPSIEPNNTSKGNSLRVSQDELSKSYAGLQQAMKHPPSSEEFYAYMATRPTDSINFVEHVKNTVSRLPPSAKVQLGRVLSFLDTRLGSLISTWSLTPLPEQPLHIKEGILKSWKSSWLPIWPALFKTFVFLGKTCWYRTDPLIHRLSGYDWYRGDYKPGASVDFNFINPATESQTIETDVVIIGSGCGGGVCAKVLAEAGHRVLVVERGHYYPPDHLPMGPESLERLFQGGGSLSSSDASIYTTTASLRKQWAKDDGLDLFSSSEYQNSLDRVCDFMGVSSSGIKHNYPNKVLIEGSKKLNWNSQVVAQNTGGATDHVCGSRCGYGCSAGHKQGPAVSWLPAAGKAGAKFMEGLDVQKILFDDVEGKKSAIGLVGKWSSQEGVERTVYVRAKKVIVSGGALNSPLILLKSGLKNPNIGNNLRLHPTGQFIATFDEDVNGWEGEIITSVVDEFADLDGNGYGTRIEACSMLPQYAIFGVRWENALQFKTDALKYRQNACYISLVRDRTAGKVFPDKDGYPVIEYNPTKADRHLDDPDFVAWIKLLEGADLQHVSSVYGSAHQMGSCRMSSDESLGAVDQNGKLWEAENLYVADASVFPTALGVNPMITTMAIADHIARAVAATM